MYCWLPSIFVLDAGFEVQMVFGASYAMTLSIAEARRKWAQ